MALELFDIEACITISRAAGFTREFIRSYKVVLLTPLQTVFSPPLLQETGHLRLRTSEKARPERSLLPPLFAPDYPLSCLREISPPSETESERLLHSPFSIQGQAHGATGRVAFEPLEFEKTISQRSTKGSSDMALALAPVDVPRDKKESVFFPCRGKLCMRFSL